MALSATVNSWTDSTPGGMLGQFVPDPQELPRPGGLAQWRSDSLEPSNTHSWAPAIVPNVRVPSNPGSVFKKVVNVRPLVGNWSMRSISMVLVKVGLSTTTMGVTSLTSTTALVAPGTRTGSITALWAAATIKVAWYFCIPGDSTES